jgi:DNA-binding transcriptional ArsR family regulator
MSVVEDGTASKIMQPLRLRIIRVLMEAGEPCYIDQIARELKEDPQLISFHLDKMEDNGLVKSTLNIVQKSDSKRGWAGRFFEPMPKLRDTFAQIAQVANEYVEGLDGI